MKVPSILFSVLVSTACQQVSALSVAPEEFFASRQMACVLAEESLGFLSEEEYGLRMHTILDGFDESERDSILAKAIGYYDGLMFEVAADDYQQVVQRLELFVASNTCVRGYQETAVSL